MKTLIGSLLDKLDILIPADLTVILTSMLYFSVHPGPSAMNRICARIESSLINFSSLDLAGCYWALGLLDETARPVFVAIALKLGEKYEAGLLEDSAAKLAAPPPDDVDEDMDEASTSEEVKPLSHKQRVIKAAEEERDAALRAAAKPDVSPRLIDAMRRAWVTSTHTGKRNGKDLNTVLRTLKMLNVPHEGERQPTKDGLFSVDIVLRPKPGKLVALQVVLEHEHTRNTGQFLGTVRLERLVLERNGYEVKYMRSVDLKKAAGAQWPLLVADTIRSVGCHVSPAAVHTATALYSARAGAQGGGGRAGGGGFGGAEERSSEGRQGGAPRRGGAAKARESKEPRGPLFKGGWGRHDGEDSAGGFSPDELSKLVSGTRTEHGGRAPRQGRRGA
eukprot:gene27782-4033_t